jgi:hypothetical protein
LFREALAKKQFFFSFYFPFSLLITSLCLPFSLKFISGNNLLPQNLDNTSDPYCTLVFTDHLGNPVSQQKAARPPFKTKCISGTLNPTWNQSAVFEADDDFLLATYAHIEVHKHLIIGASLYFTSLL